MRHIRVMRKRWKRRISSRRQPSKSSGETGKPKSIKLPETLSLESDTSLVTKFFNSYQDKVYKQNRPAFFDFVSLKKIGPAATLLLVAEIDRWRKKSDENPAQLRAHRITKWDPNVKSYFIAFGLFDLLEVKNTDPKRKQFEENFKSANVGLHVCRFKTGNRVEAKKFGEIQEELKTQNFHLGWASKPILMCVNEALTNVANHAYKGIEIEKKINGIPVLLGQWWMSASFNEQDNVFEFMVLDQGITIPKSLQEQPNIIAFWPGANDSELIEAATDEGKSSTKEKHRGKGLNEMRKFVENSNHKDDLLRIISGRGVVEIHGDGNKISKRQLNTALRGTLLHWRIHIDSQGEEYATH